MTGFNYDAGGARRIRLASRKCRLAGRQEQVSTSAQTRFPRIVRRIMNAGASKTVAACPEPVRVDRELVRKCQAGDDAARQMLYEACMPRVYRLAIRLVGPQDAADVTQTVFLQAFSRLDQFQGAARFETWLYRLAVNEALQFLRRQKRHRSVPLETEPSAKSDRSRPALEARELLDLAFAQIDPDLRAIFLLRESEQMSYEEIAETLEIPAGTVGSRLNRARKQLESVLSRLGWAP